MATLVAALACLVGPAPGSTAGTGGSLSATPTRVKPGGLITLTGTVPPRRERTVLLQRRRGTSWVTMTRRNTGPHGGFTFRTRAFATSTTYRVLAPRARIGSHTYASVHTPSRRVTTVQRSTPFVRRVSSNGRYFLDQHGRPILIKGDSPWAILVNASRAQMDMYVSVRDDQGFNTVLVSLLGNTVNGGPADSGATYDGVRPFVNGNPGHLNPTYWNRVAHFLAKCRAAGITVMAYPLDGWTGTSHSSGVGRSWSDATARRYGEAVAARLHGYENVIWSVGGDYSPWDGANSRFRSVLAGLAAGGMNRTSTIQLIADSTSLDSSYWDEKVDFSFVYSYALTYAMVQKGYRQTNPSGHHVPALLGETHYEAYQDVTDLYLRSMAAWALTSGSPGEFYGSEDVWQMPPRRSALQTRAVAQLSALRRAFQRQSGWQRLVPDFSSAFITGGRGTKGNATDDYFPGDTGGSYVTGSRTPDGRLAVIYLPDATQRITIDQSKMGPGYTARWVNPTNGNTIGATEGATYARNAPHADGADDWLLVLTATRSR